MPLVGPRAPMSAVLKLRAGDPSVDGNSQAIGLNLHDDLRGKNRGRPVAVALSKPGWRW